MKIKEQNSGNSWQSRVRKYDSNLNITITKEESWKKIRARLDKVPKRRNRTWYWLAAASAVLFVLITVNIPVSNRTFRPGFVKTPVVLKQERNIPLPVDTIQAVICTAIKTSSPERKTAAPRPGDSLQVAGTKKESVLPSPGESGLSLTGTDTAVVEDDVAQHPTRLPSVHINDIIDDGPRPEPITLQGLAVKKLIRLFSLDFAKEHPAKKQGARPPAQYYIPDNQN